MKPDETYGRYGETMYDYLALRLGSREDAEDVLSDAPYLITGLVALADMKILLLSFNRIVSGQEELIQMTREAEHPPWYFKFAGGRGTYLFTKLVSEKDDDWTRREKIE
jgi:hypothetical protein